MAFETCNPVENYMLNNVHEQGQDDLHLLFGLATPSPMSYSNQTSPPNLEVKSSSYPTTVVFENVGFAPLMPDMFTNEEAAPRRDTRHQIFKVLPRFSSLRTEVLPMLHHKDLPSMMDAVSSDDEEEESSPGDVASFTALSLEEEGKEEEGSLATLSSMETTRQERLDASRKAKISPKKKVLHVKQPAPQRPALRTQPRRNSFNAIAA